MITELGVENFKSWKDTGKIEFAPLTGFFGANSSGKTSLLQVLLMLKQTVERPSDWNDALDFGNQTSLVNLGNFRDVVYNHRQDLSIGISVSWNLPEKLIIQKSRERHEAPIETTTLSFSTFVTKIDRHLVASDYITYTVDDRRFSIEWNPDGSGRSLKPELMFSPGSLYRCYGVRDRSPGNLKPFFWQFEEAFEELFFRIRYLGPRRDYPRPYYIWEGDHPKGVGQYERAMVSALFSAKLQLLDLDAQVPRWLQRLGLIDSYRLVPISGQENRYEFLVTKHKGGPEVRLMDVGFGVSQILPVLILCYYVPEGSILILEQPEAHLHPKVQSDLADVLIDVVKNRKLQIILESHSEHLLHRLTRRIAEGEISADDTALYFCQINEGTSEIEQLKLDEYGNASNWPRDFFGDDAGDVVERTKVEMKRREMGK